MGTAERNSKTPCVSAKTNISRVTHIVSMLVSQNRSNENGEHSLPSHFPSPPSFTLPSNHHLAGFSSWFMRFLILEKTRAGTHCAPVEARVRSASAKTTCLATTKSRLLTFVDQDGVLLVSHATNTERSAVSMLSYELRPRQLVEKSRDEVGRWGGAGPSPHDLKNEDLLQRVTMLVFLCRFWSSW